MPNKTEELTVHIIGHFEQIAGVGRRRYYYHVGLAESGLVRERVIASNFIEAVSKGLRLAPGYGIPANKVIVAGTDTAEVAILLNRSSRFSPYTDGDLLEEVWHGYMPWGEMNRVRKLDRNDPTDRYTDAELLAAAWERFNLRHPDDYRQRSLSVGDVIVLDHNRAYAVERFGFRRLELWGSQEEREAIERERADEVDHPAPPLPDNLAELLRARFEFLHGIDPTGHPTEEYIEPSGADVLDTLCQLYIEAIHTAHATR